MENLRLYSHPMYFWCLLHHRVLCEIGAGNAILYLFIDWFFSRAACVAYGNFQARGWVRTVAATSVSYTIAHGSIGSLTDWARPEMEPACSWILVGLGTAEPPWEIVPCGILDDLSHSPFLAVPILGNAENSFSSLVVHSAKCTDFKEEHLSSNSHPVIFYLYNVGFIPFFSQCLHAVVCGRIMGLGNRRLHFSLSLPISVILQDSQEGFSTSLVPWSL